MKLNYSLIVVFIIVAVNLAASQAVPKPIENSVLTQKDEIIGRITFQCCKMGRETKNNHCDGYTPTPQYDYAWNNFCKMEYSKCCSAEKATRACETGRLAAFDEKIHCNQLVATDALRIFQWHCCEACREGINLGRKVTKPEDCHWRAETERLEDKSVVECCVRTFNERKNRRDVIPSKTAQSKGGNIQDEPVDPCVDCEHSCTSDESNSRHCTCNDGYNLAGNGKNCIDIDECKLLSPPCNGTSICTNMPGSYECHVNDLIASGSEESTEVANLHVTTTTPETTQDPDSQLIESSTLGITDEVTAVTVTPDEQFPTENSVTNKIDRLAPITCDNGYKVVDRECVDIDECEENLHDCKDTEKCVNDDGAFNCKSIECREKGFVYDHEKETCVDIDECEEAVQNNATICADHQTCVNYEGNFKCEEKCQPGFKLAKGWWQATCEDINECQLGTDDCVEPHVCHNTEGSYECRCKQGYEEDPNDKHCVDINECKLEPSVCLASAVCHNSPGSFECKCLPGFIETITGSCVDIDECAEDPNPCGPNTRCKNLAGHYECECVGGYYYNDDRSKCITNMKCQGIEKDGQCTCPQGFKIVHDHTCTDIDECEDGPGCRYDEICLNMFGSFKCLPSSCPEHYTESVS